MSSAFLELPGMHTRFTYLPPVFSQSNALVTVAPPAHPPANATTGSSTAPTALDFHLMQSPSRAHRGSFAAHPRPRKGGRHGGPATRNRSLARLGSRHRDVRTGGLLMRPPRHGQAPPHARPRPPI